MSVDDVIDVLNDASDEVRFHVPLNEGGSISLPELQKLMVLVVGKTHCGTKPEDMRKALDAAIKKWAP